MQYEKLIGEVQHHGRMSSRTEADKAVRAVLETLSERLEGGAAGNLAAQLPHEIARYLESSSEGERFSLDEFFERVSERSEVDKPKAVYYCRVVLKMISEAVSPGTMDKIREQLPDGYDSLFEAGSEGDMDLRNSREEVLERSR